MESVKRRLATKPTKGKDVYVADSADVIGEVELQLTIAVSGLMLF